MQKLEKSKYAKKKLRSAKGRFRRTSPFSQEHAIDRGHRLAAYYDRSVRLTMTDPWGRKIYVDAVSYGAGSAR